MWLSKNFFINILESYQCTCDFSRAAYKCGIDHLISGDSTAKEYSSLSLNKTEYDFYESISYFKIEFHFNIRVKLLVHNFNILLTYFLQNC